MSNTSSTPVTAGGQAQDYMRVKDITRMYSINASTWFRWRKAGIAPNGKLITRKCRVWTRAEVMAVGALTGAAA